MGRKQRRGIEAFGSFLMDWGKTTMQQEALDKRSKLAVVAANAQMEKEQAFEREMAGAEDTAELKVLKMQHQYDMAGKLLDAENDKLNTAYELKHISKNQLALGKQQIDYDRWALVSGFSQDDATLGKKFTQEERVLKLEASYAAVATEQEAQVQETATRLQNALAMQRDAKGTANKLTADKSLAEAKHAYNVEVLKWGWFKEKKLAELTHALSGDEAKVEKLAAQVQAKVVVNLVDRLKEYPTIAKRLELVETVKAQGHAGMMGLPNNFFNALSVGDDNLDILRDAFSIYAEETAGAEYSNFAKMMTDDDGILSVTTFNNASRQFEQNKVIGPDGKPVRSLKGAQDIARFDIEQEDRKGKKQVLADKATRMNETIKREANIIISTVDEALDMVGQHHTTGLVGSIMQYAGGSEAGVLRSATKTLKAIISIQRLQEMRRNNPRGAGVGNVALGEMEMFGATLGALEVALDDEHLARNLLRVKYESERVMDAVLVDEGVKDQAWFDERHVPIEQMQYMREIGGAPEQNSVDGKYYMYLGGAETHKLSWIEVTDSKAAPWSSYDKDYSENKRVQEDRRARGQERYAPTKKDGE